MCCHSNFITLLCSFFTVVDYSVIDYLTVINVSNMQLIRVIYCNPTVFLADNVPADETHSPTSTWFRALHARSGSSPPIGPWSACAGPGLCR